jgi:MFS family permease
VTSWERTVAARRRRAIHTAVLFATLGQGIAVPVLPEIQNAFSVTSAQVALVTSVWGAARLLADLPLGLIVDRLSRGYALVAGCALSLIGALGAAIAPTFEVLLVARAISGVGAACISISAVINLMNLSEPGKRGRTLGIYQAALQASSSVGPLAAGIAAAIGGWHAAFLVAAIGALVATISLVAAGQLREQQPVAPRPVAGLASIGVAAGRSLGHRMFPWTVHLTTFALFFVTGAIIQNTLPLFASSEIGLGPAAIGLLLAGATALRFVVGLVGAEASDRVGRLLVLSAGMVVMIVALLLFRFVDTTLAFVLVTLLLAAGRLGNSVPMILLSDHAGDSKVGTLVGTNRFSGDIALVIGPVAAGFVIDRSGFDAAFAMVAVVVAASLISLLAGGKARGRSGPAVLIEGS